MGVNQAVPINVIARVFREIWKYQGDLTVCVSGDEGSGKSTLCYWLAVLTQPDFDIHTQVSFFADDSIELLLNAPSKSVVWLDENPFYKRDTAARASKDAIKIMKRNRFLKRLYLICALKLGDLDLDLRDQRVKLWIRVTERGKAFIYEPIPVEKGDRWNLEEKEIVMNRKNGRGFVKFDAMPVDVEEEYDVLKMAQFNELRKKYADKKNGSSKVGNESKNGRVKVEQVIRIANKYHTTEKEACDVLGYNYNSHCAIKSRFKVKVD